MTSREAVAEVFLKAFNALKQQEKDEVLHKFLAQQKIRKDLLDLALIEAARAEKGKDISIEEYRRRRGLRK